MKRNTIFILAAILILSVLGRSPLAGQEVRLRKGDTVKLEVAQREDLGRLLAIDGKGEVGLPIVGAVHIEGLTIEEARGTLLRALQELYPSIQSVSLTLVGERARRFVYVQGQVAQAGKYEFEGLSNIWEAIKEAGGATSGAVLEAVRLIRAEGDRSTTTIVNVQQALDSGDIKSLPPLKPGDTIVVPERSAAYTGMGAVKVIGAVARPSSYFLSGDKRLLDAILAAGGGAENANLSRVNILRMMPEGGTMKIEVNFGRYLETGDMRQNPPILPNDTVSVPRSSSYWTVLTSPSFLLGLIATSATIYAVVHTR